MRKIYWQVLLCGMAAAYSMVVADDATSRPALPFTVGKETTVITSPLREDGTPDYVGAMNEKYGKSVKGEENLVVGWLKVVGTGEKFLPEKTRAKFLELIGGKEEVGMKWQIYWEYLRDGGMEHQAIGDYVGDEIRARGRLWNENDFPKLAEYLKARKEFLDASKEAFVGKKYWMPLVGDDGVTLNSATLKLPQYIREILGALGERATLRMKGGDFDGFMEDVGLIEKVARQMERAGTMTERLAGLGADGMCSRMIGAAAGSGMLTQGQCVTLWKMMDGMEQPASIEEAIDRERRWLLLERAVLVATGKAEILHRENPSYGTYNRVLESMEAEQVDWDAALRLINQGVDATMADLKKATGKELLEKEKAQELAWSDFFADDRDSAKKEGETREAYTKRMASALGMMVGINLQRAELTRREAELQRKMARVMVGVAAFKAEKGRWPENLGELVPGFVKEIPRDIYSEGEKGEILYAKAESGVRVYSVGTNGNDDGGVKDDPYHQDTGADDIAIGAGVDAK